MHHFKNFFFKFFSILVIALFVTSCTTPWVNDFQMDYALKTLAVGGGAAATYGIGYGIYYLVADLPEKAQKEYDQISEQIEEARTLSEISDAIEKAKKYDEKSNHFNYDGIITTANDKLQSLSLPYQVQNNLLQFDISYLLQKCTSLSDIQNLITTIKENGLEDSLKTVTDEINKYMYSKNIPYTFNPNTLSFDHADSISNILQKLKNSSLAKRDMTILLQWVEENMEGLNDEELVTNYISSTLDEIIRTRIYNNQDTSSLYNVCLDYIIIFEKYLNMDSTSLQDYITSKTQYFSEEKLYNEAMAEGNPYIYSEKYPNGQFDVSKIKINNELKDFLNAKTSLNSAKEFQEKYPNSQYSEEIESYIAQEEQKIQEEKLKEWQSSNEFKILQSNFGTDKLTKELYVGQNGFPFTSLEITLNDFLKGIDWRPFNISITKSLWNDELILKRTIGYEPLEVSIKFESDKAIFTSASFEALDIYSTYNYQDIALVLGCLFVPAEKLNQLIMLNNMYEVI